MIRIRYPARYLRFFRIRIGFGYSFLKKNGSGYWFHFYNEIFPRVVQDVANDGAALITINGDSCYFIVNFFRPSGSGELLLYC